MNDSNKSARKRKSIYLPGSFKTVFIRHIVTIEWDNRDPSEAAVLRLTNGDKTIIRNEQDLQILSQYYKY